MHRLRRAISRFSCSAPMPATPPPRIKFFLSCTANAANSPRRRWPARLPITRSSRPRSSTRRGSGSAARRSRSRRAARSFSPPRGDAEHTNRKARRRIAVRHGGELAKVSADAQAVLVHALANLRARLPLDETNVNLLCDFACVEAVPGQPEVALRGVHRAVKLVLTEHEHGVGPQVEENLAFVYAWTGTEPARSKPMRGCSGLCVQTRGRAVLPSMSCATPRGSLPSAATRAGRHCSPPRRTARRCFERFPPISAGRECCVHGDISPCRGAVVGLRDPADRRMRSDRTPNRSRPADPFILRTWPAGIIGAFCSLDLNLKLNININS